MYKCMQRSTLSRELKTTSNFTVLKLSKQSLSMFVMDRVCVVVGGDFGRSPRMQYHSLSLAEHNFAVDVVAYKGTRPHEQILDNDRITLHLMPETPDFGKYFPKLVTYGLKTIWQSIVLLSFLFALVKPKYILVQNPPSIPILPVLWFYCCIRRVNLIIDWHNYGFTILALSLTPNHFLVRVCRFVEGYFGSKASKHLCVTKALQCDLKERWNIDAVVLYDCPADVFQPITIEDKHSLFLKLKSEYSEICGDTVSETRFTEQLENGDIVEKYKRPALIITSTSWTEDEDFSLLMKALKTYDSQAVNEENSLPPIVCAITGKGPLKQHYENVIRNENWKRVEFLLPWMEAEDYPKLLASCDLGVCLHTSSSGLDLPMKIVDMFGCGLPVCAVAYSTLHELLESEVNGLVFTNSDELCSCLTRLLKDFPELKTLKKMRKNIIEEYKTRRWTGCWHGNASLLFE